MLLLTTNVLIYELFCSVGSVQLFNVSRYFICLINIWNICIQLGGLQYVEYSYGEYHIYIYIRHCALTFVIVQRKQLVFVKGAGR